MLEQFARLIWTFTGYIVLTIACAIIITFMLWVIKIEFEWFWGIEIFKTLSKFFKKLFNKISTIIYNINIKSKSKIGNVKKVKHTILNETIEEEPKGEEVEIPTYDEVKEIIEKERK